MSPSVLQSALGMGKRAGSAGRGKAGAKLKEGGERKENWRGGEGGLISGTAHGVEAVRAEATRTRPEMNSLGQRRPRTSHRGKNGMLGGSQ